MYNNMTPNYYISLNDDPINIKHDNDKYSIIYKTNMGKEINIIPTINSSSMYNKIPHNNYKIMLHNHNDNSDENSENDNSDEIIISDSQKKILNKYIEKKLDNTIIHYNMNYNLIYNKFLLYNKNGKICCDAVIDNDIDSYYLVLNEYRGICIYFDINLSKLNTLNNTYIVYSKNIKKSEFIKIKNSDYYIINEDQLEYYPIYIICCYTKHTMEDFIYLYPYLIKNIFYNLL